MMFMILIDKINCYFYISLIVIRIVIVTIVDMIFSFMVGEMLQSKHQASSFLLLSNTLQVVVIRKHIAKFL